MSSLKTDLRIPMKLGCSKPFISVVVAVYNGALTIQQCIDTVASQTFSDVELMIVDGGSTDGTVSLYVHYEL